MLKYRLDLARTSVVAIEISKEYHTHTHVSVELLSLTTESLFYKNAFQWDAYCPFVNRLPGGMSAKGGCLPGGVCRSCVPRGVCAGGVCPGGCLPGGCLPGGCQSGGCVPGGVCQEVCARMGVCHPPWTDRHLRKHNLRKLCLRAVKM